ncbi:MAG: fumarylacetoacetate hydrolase family protein [Ignavibacteriota bacterium]
MKFVTYKGPVPKEPESTSGSASIVTSIGNLFQKLAEKNIKLPYAPVGRLGFLVEGKVIDVAAASMKFDMLSDEKQLLRQTLPSDILTFLAIGESAIKQAQEVHSWLSKRTIEELNKGFTIAWPTSDVKILSPVPRPTSMRDGYAFRQHVEAARRNRGVEMIPEFDLFPVFYFTNHQAVIGPGDMEVMPEHLKKLDFELEAAIVIGKEGKNIKAENADEYIFGYTIMNDWSARYLQMEEMKLSLGPAKGKDFATAIGPYLITKDELESRRIPGSKGERYDLEMTCRIGNEEVSRGNLKDMTWTFAQIIERASYGVTLYPGDVIGSGTVGTGCFLELNGSKVFDNRWVGIGDEVICSIEKLGELTNTVVAGKLN